MRGTSYSREVKRLVQRWRANGRTYAEIKARFNVPKSTLSTWLNKKYPATRERMLKHLSVTRPLALAAVQHRIAEKNRVIKEKIAAEVKTYPLREIGLQKVILASLYWAEGAKYLRVYGLNLANTDPQMVKLFITLLRRCYPVDEKKFRVRLHVHHYHHLKQVVNFWSTLLNVPTSQFNRTYIKKRSKTKRFRKNFMGICFLKYLDSDMRKELLATAEQLHIHYCGS